MALPANGTLSYNGITFDGLIRSNVSGHPVYDEAGRAVKYVVYTIHVEGYITHASDTGTSLDSMRNALLQPGGALEYTNKGFGTFSINSGATKDVVWGPTPQLLEFTPVGASLGAFVVWQCEVHIPQCSAATYQFALMSVNYEVLYDIDKDGYTKLTIQGYLEIPQTRQAVGNRNLSDTADNYRSLIKPQVPIGFQRIRQSFTEDKSKNRLNFVFVDEEIPFALPNGCTQCDITQHVDGDISMGFNQWIVVFEGRIVLNRAIPKAFALEKFLMIVKSRMAGLIGANKHLQRIRYSDAIFGRHSSFMAAVRVLGVGINQILAGSGMWSYVPGTDFGQWKTSLQNTAFHERGYAKIKNTTSTDAIVDLCIGQTPSTMSAVGAAGNQSSFQTVVNSVSGSSGGSGMVGFPGGFAPQINALTSWLDYKNKLAYDEDKRMIRHKPLDGQTATLSTAPNPAGANNQFASATGTFFSTSQANNSDVVQRLSTPAVKVVMMGYGRRLGYRVPAPQLTSVGGEPAIEDHRTVAEEYDGAVGGIPIFKTTWRIEYLLTKPPQSNVGTLANPQIGQGGTTSNQVTIGQQ